MIKTLFNKTQLLLFCFEIYPYLIEEEKEVFYKKLNEYNSKLDDKFFNHYNKIWKNNNLLYFN